MTQHERCGFILWKTNMIFFKRFNFFFIIVENQSSKTRKCLRLIMVANISRKTWLTSVQEKNKVQIYNAYTSTQNGSAEWMTRSIEEKVTAMVSLVNLTRTFLVKPILKAVHIFNWSPSTPLAFKIQEKMWFGKEPSYCHLRVFGCEAYANVPEQLQIN